MITELFAELARKNAVQKTPGKSGRSKHQHKLLATSELHVEKPSFWFLGYDGDEDAPRVC